MNPPEPPIREVSGKLIIVIILILGVGAAACAWGLRFSRTNQVLAFWGGENAAMIRDRNSHFALVQIDPDPQDTADHQDPLQIAGQSFYVVQEINITNAPGTSHARDSLLDDLNFRWGEEVDDASQPVWRYLLRFADNDRSVMAAIDLTSGRLLYVEENRELFLSPEMTGDWRLFIEEHFEDKAENEP